MFPLMRNISNTHTGSALLSSVFSTQTTIVIYQFFHIYLYTQEQTQRGVSFHILFTYLVFPSHAFRFPAIENITFSVLLIFLRTLTHKKKEA